MFDTEVISALNMWLSVVFAVSGVALFLAIQFWDGRFTSRPPVKPAAAVPPMLPGETPQQYVARFYVKS